MLQKSHKTDGASSFCPQPPPHFRRGKRSTGLNTRMCSEGSAKRIEVKLRPDSRLDRWCSQLPDDLARNLISPSPLRGTCGVLTDLAPVTAQSESVTHEGSAACRRSSGANP